MLSDEKFCERALKFALFKNVDGKYFGYEDYRKAIETQQTDKDKKVVYLYSTDAEAQYAYIEAAKSKGYDVLIMDCELDAHFVNLLEQKIENSRFARVDSDSIDNLVRKEDKSKPELSEEELNDLSDMFKAVLPEGNDYMVNADNAGENAAPILITQNEFMRRYREMSALGGGMNFYGEMPDSYNITVNLQNPLVARVMEDAKAGIEPMESVPEADRDIVARGEAKDASAEDKAAAEEARKAEREAKEAAREKHKAIVDKFAADNAILKQITDLALLANGMLKGKALSDFIERSRKVAEDAYLK